MIQKIVISEGITGIDRMSSNNTSTDISRYIREIVLPESMTSIGEYAFADYTLLEKINIPQGITCIRRGTFSRCGALTSIEIPDHVTVIEEKAFYGCEKLKDIQLPQGLTTIGKQAFYLSDYLWMDISVPDSVTSIGQNAFGRGSCIVTEKCSAYAYGWAKQNGYSCRVKEHAEVVTDEAVEATCTEDGLTEGAHCAFCGEVLTAQEQIPSPGHHVVTDEEAKAPGCTTPGHTASSHCDVCNEILQTREEIPPAGHRAVIDPGTPSTAASSGLTDGSHCSVCGMILQDQKVIPPQAYAAGTQYEDGNGFLYDCSYSINTANYITYFDQVNRKATQLRYTIIAQYEDGSTPDVIILQKNAGAEYYESNSVNLTEGNLTVFQDTLASGENYTQATFGFQLRKSGVVYVTLTGGGLSKRSQDIEIYTRYTGYPGTWVIQYSQQGSSVVDLTQNDQYKNWRIYLEDDGTGFYVSNGAAEMEWTKSGNVLQIYGVTVTKRDDGDIAFPLGDGIYNIYRHQEADDAPAAIQPHLGTWKAYLAVKDSEGIQVPVSELNDSVGKRVYLHADSTIYIPYADRIESGNLTVIDNRVYIDGQPSNFAFNQYGQLIRYLDQGIVLLYMRVGGQAIPDVVKYTGHWYADSCLWGDARDLSTDMIGLGTLFDFEAFLQLDGKITVKSCGRTETGTWMVTNGKFKSEGLSGTISFTHQGELLYNTGNGYSLHCTKTKPSGTLSAMTLPDALSEIEDEAFANTQMTRMILPEQCTRIGARAFEGCSDLRMIYMPDSLTEIAEGTFNGCDQVVFLCESDNAAAAYARLHGIRVIVRNGLLND